MANPWKTLSSKVIYENSWLKVREDAVIRPDGAPGIYSVIVMPQSVGIVAIDNAGRVALVRQWRYTLNKDSTEIPTGQAASVDGDVQDAAERELREETGLAARTWAPMGSIDNSNGATTDVAHLFMARDLTLEEATPEGNESIELIWLPFGDAVEDVMNGKITESVSVAAILKAKILMDSQ